MRGMASEPTAEDEWPPAPRDDFGKMSTRARNALRRAGMRTFAELSLCTVQDLMELRWFGAACCAEVIDVLRSHGLGLAKSLEELELPDSGQLVLPRSGSSLDEKIAWLGGPQTVATFVRHEGRLRREARDRGLDAIASCIARVESELAGGRIDDEGVMGWEPARSMAQRFNPEPRKLSQLLRFLQYDPPAPDRIATFESALDLSTIEDEAAALLSTLDPRQESIVRARFRLGDRAMLDELGAEWGVTRERVRQIESQARALVQARFRVGAFPRTRSGMAITRRARSLAKVEKTLVAHDLVRSADGVGDFLLLWRAVDPEDRPFPPAWSDEAKRGLTAIQRRLAPEILKHAGKLVRQTGMVFDHEVLTVLDRRDLEAPDIAAVLRDAGMQQVQNSAWLRRAGKSVPLAVASKMLCKCGPLTLKHLRRGLSRHQRRQGFPVRSADALKLALSIYPELLVKGEIVTLARGVSCNLGRSEQTWIDLVSRSGPVVHSDQIQAAFAAARLKPVTAHVLMTNSEIVQRLQRALYCLPGATVTDADILRARAEAIRIDPASLMEFGLKGTIRFETTLQQYITYGGSIGAGPAARLVGKWKLTISGRASGQITVGSPWIYGLSGARDLLQLRPGDRIIVEFNTWTRSADLSFVSRVDERES